MTTDDSASKPLSPAAGAVYGGLLGGLLGFVAWTNAPVSGKTALKITAGTVALGSVLGAWQARRIGVGNQWTAREEIRKATATEDSERQR